MGLLLSILVGCVGVIELLASLKQVSTEVSNTSTGPSSPCLSYHGATTEIPSFHDSLCSISHSGDIPVSGSARRKLENLHEYSLRVRSELKSHGGADWSTMSDCSTRDLLSPSRTDSRLSLNYDLVLDNDEDAWKNSVARSAIDQETMIVVEVDRATEPDDNLVIEEINEPEVMALTKLTATGVDKYVRIPTPIPLGISQEISRSNSSLDVSSSFDNESGNEAPTKKSFDQVPIVLSRNDDDTSSSSPQSSIDERDDISSRVRKRGFIRISRSRSPDVTKNHTVIRDHVVIKSTPQFLMSDIKLDDDNFTKNSADVSYVDGPSVIVDEVDAVPFRSSDCVQRRNRSEKGRNSSTILRKPTRLKSKNAEISKSAENLAGRTERSKRHRDPKRRKSDISVQTMKREDSLRDEWTNTSPTGSEISLSASRTSISVQVQTSFDEPGHTTFGGTEDSQSFMSFDIPVTELSRSKRDGGMKDRDHFGRRAFKNRRFPTSITSKSRSLDDCTTNHWLPGEQDASVLGAHDKSTWDNRKRLETMEPHVENNGWGSSRADTRDRYLGTSRSTEEESVDEEYVDAEEASTSLSGNGPIEYCIPSTDESDKPFWVILDPLIRRR